MFSDLNFAEECETNCGTEMFECIAECGESTECISLCYRDQVVCIDACPCHAGNDCEFKIDDLRTRVVHGFSDFNIGNPIWIGNHDKIHNQDLAVNYPRRGEIQ